MEVPLFVCIRSDCNHVTEVEDRKICGLAVYVMQNDRDFVDVILPYLMWCIVLIFACMGWWKSRMTSGSLICRPRCWWREIRRLDRRWATCRKDHAGRCVCKAIGYKAHQLGVWTISHWNSEDINNFTRVFRKFCCLFSDHYEPLDVV